MSAKMADEIWTHATIKTMNPQQPTAEAFAVKNGQLMAIGSNADIQKLADSSTISHKLNGKFVMPGLVESHTHALWGACRDLFDVYVGYEASFDELMHAVEVQVSQVEAGTCIVGGPWRPDMLELMGDEPRKVLDKVSPHHPVALQDVTQHSLWCNSLALEKAGITANSADIVGGVINRHAKTGEPTGILAETACAPVTAITQRSDAQLADACRYFVHYFNSLGFTGFKEPMAFESDLAAYKAADQRGELTLHMAAHIVRSSPYTQNTVPYEEMERLREQYRSGNIRTDYAKLFLDGVAPSFTAAFIDPYLASAGYDAEHHDPDSVLLIDPATMAETMAELDRRGFVVKTHAVGDHAARITLDAIEAARKINGDSGIRHEVSHCPFVTPVDRERFAQLGAVAEMSPKLWFPNAGTAGQLRVLGEERVETCHAFKSMLKAGVEMTYGSDWPAAAPDANPWSGLAGMISRQNHSGLYPGTVGADEAISLDEALPLFTQQGARALGMESETGSLEPGKWADFIVLDDPLDTMSPENIAKIQVRATYWKGRKVFSR